MVSARVFDNEKGFGPEFDYLAIIAAFGQDRFLMDVGFGEFAFHPLKIVLNKEMNDPRGIFRIEIHDEEYKVVRKKNAAGEFIPEYLFSEKKRQLSDFYEMCLYHQTSPASHFTQKRICSLPTGEGRISLTGNTLKITEKVPSPKRNWQQKQKCGRCYGIILRSNFERLFRAIPGWRLAEFLFKIFHAESAGNAE